MKRIILGLMVAMLFCTLAQGANRTVTENDSLGNKKRVIELRDSVIGGKTVTDTLSIMSYENSGNTDTDDDSGSRKHHNSNIGWDIPNFNFNNTVTAGMFAAFTVILFVFGLPLIIIFLIFFFRYKNRKAKYRLAEQALASGQPLPDNFFKQVEIDSTYNKGIKNIFTGIGLFIFLWAITGEFGLGCIGLLIMFTGFGQLVIHYSQQKKNEERR